MVVLKGKLGLVHVPQTFFLYADSAAAVTRRSRVGVCSGCSVSVSPGAGCGLTLVMAKKTTMQSQWLVLQVNALQKGFLTLSDALLEELGEPLLSRQCTHAARL